MPANMLTYLAGRLGMSTTEVASFAAVRYGWRAGWRMSNEVAIAVMDDLDSQYCIRTVPQAYWPQPRDPNRCHCSALGGLEHAPGPECPAPSR